MRLDKPLRRQQGSRTGGPQLKAAADKLSEEGCGASTWAPVNSSSKGAMSQRLLYGSAETIAPHPSPFRASSTIAVANILLRSRCRYSAPPAGSMAKRGDHTNLPTVCWHLHAGYIRRFLTAVSHLANAGAHPGAVVVEPLDAVVADSAVRAARRPEVVAGGAPLSGHLLVGGHLKPHAWLWDPSEQR